MREETLRRLRVLGFPTYEAYIRSDLWRANKDRLGVLRPTKCSICPSRVKLHAHHVSYDRVGAEQPGDLIVVCSRCHEEIHKLVNKGTPLIRAHIVWAERLRGVKGPTTKPSAKRPVKSKPKPRRKKNKSRKVVARESKPHITKVRPLRAEVDYEASRRRQTEEWRARRPKKTGSRSKPKKAVKIDVVKTRRIDLEALADIEARSRRV